jgi:hypothetical protein
MLKASKRASNEDSRKIGKLLKSDTLSEKYPGPRNWLRCVFPIAHGLGLLAEYATQAGGAVKEDGSNHAVLAARVTLCVTL